MSNQTAATTQVSEIPPSLAKVLRRFRAMGREEKMAALLQYARQLEPLPARYEAIDRTNFVVPECQTRVDIFPVVNDGLMHYYADVNVRQSPTVAAFLALTLQAVNDQPPAVTLAIPADFVSQVMESVGLHARETGLSAMVARLKRYAGEAQLSLNDNNR
ncbi:MAG TPA: SufE family protein [Gemmatimonadales bacterium]|nr:SufE family protein [Gemmatimonadales bacterium]